MKKHRWEWEFKEAHKNFGYSGVKRESACLRAQFPELLQPVREQEIDQ